MKKILILLAACAIAGCSKDADQPVGGASAPVRIDPTITRATEVDFEAGDAVGLTITTAEGTYAENARMIYSDGNFVSADGLLWYDDLGMTSTLKAYYPYAETVPVQFSVAEDQTAEGYSASDLMMASKEGVLPSVNAVGMTFKHKMTKLVIDVTNEYGMTVTGVAISNSVGTADVDVEAQTVAVREGADFVTVQAKEVTAGVKYNAILVPQTVALRVDVTCENDGQVEVHTQRLTASTLQSGAQYTMSVTVLPSEVKVSLSGDIEDWDNGGELGETDEVPFEEYDDYFVYDGESYKIVTLADGNTWMAENLRYVPAGKVVSSDPKVDAGVWYSYTLSMPDTKWVATADPTSSSGLLYDMPTALGVSELTVDNYKTFEGVQGICPKGWHIPTRAEGLALVGYSVKIEGETAAVINPDAAYYNTDYNGGKLSEMTEWNFQYAGARLKTTATATGSYSATSYNNVGFPTLNYMATSTGSNSTNMIKYSAFMTTFTDSYPEGRLTLADSSYANGVAVRCVKDK